MALLSELVSVVPLIAKADTMDPEQKAQWKTEVGVWTGMIHPSSSFYC
jgi:hypothetical protein